MVSALRRTVLLASLVDASWACGREPEQAVETLVEPAEPTVVPVASGPLVVEHTGCFGDVAVPRTCALREKERELRLWVDAVEPPVVSIDGRAFAAVPVPVAPIPDGWRVIVEVPEGAKELKVDAGGGSWAVGFTEVRTPIHDGFRARLPNPSDPQRAKVLPALLDEMIAAIPKDQNLDRVLLQHRASQVAWAQGLRKLAVTLARNAMSDALAQDAPTQAVLNAQNLMQFVDEDPGETEWLLEFQRLYLPLTSDATARVRWHYAKGYAQFQAGEFAGSLAEFVDSARLARRVGLSPEEQAAVPMEACVLAILGREDERRRATTRVLQLADEVPISICENAASMTNLAWSLVVAPGIRETDDARQILGRVLADFDSGGGCDVATNPGWAHAPPQARLILAIDAHLRGDIPLLRERLAWFETRERGVAERDWVAFLSADLALGEGDPSLALLRVSQVAHKAPDLLLSTKAMVLRGRALEALGARERALSAYLDSERLVERVVRSLPLDQGREALGEAMHDGASRAIAMLIEDGEPDDAARVARLSRSRGLRPAGRSGVVAKLPLEKRRNYQEHLNRYRSLSEKIAGELLEAWRLPTDERAAMLRRHASVRDEMRSALVQAYDIVANHTSVTDSELAQPSERETWLVYHPHAAGWFGFALTHGTVVARDLGRMPGLEDTTALSSWLLDPFAAEISSAAELHVLAMGSLVDVHFEGLSFEGAPLVERVPIGYALDLGSASTRTAPGRALVVGDPESRFAGSGTLQRSRQEAEDAVVGLRRAGYDVVPYLGPSAKQAHVLAELELSDWFHYAGHGYADGAAGWDSALPMAGEGRLTVADLMAMSASPRAVVLSACETAATDSSKSLGGMHVAGAFVMAGASFVIAASEEISDEEAASFSSALYGRSTELRSSTGPQLLRAILLDRSESATSFRVWIP